ncbi:hypothetical protein Lalb_Chr20g0114261 [Lupinus albus]|uniref:B box-type domain-containing protein n=1 Tax=Lupinus albus TaxID=3870 RepID=A0A6A4NQ63_LUPAL|nr:hypothetical protein Lalb_Chr20g0114261 [Lupinus albus]
MFRYKVGSRRRENRRDMNMMSYNNNNNSSGGGYGGDGGGGGVKPAWLERLMAETFFGGCGVHQNQRKNEKNIFCLHCCLSICPHCLSSHRPHPLLQVLYINSLGYVCKFVFRFCLSDDSKIFYLPFISSKTNSQMDPNLHTILSFF